MPGPSSLPPGALRAFAWRAEPPPWPPRAG